MQIGKAPAGSLQGKPAVRGLIWMFHHFYLLHCQFQIKVNPTQVHPALYFNWKEFYKSTKRTFRAASEEARKPLLPPDADAQWRNNSPIPAHQITPAKCSFSTPVRFPLASVSNVPVAIKGGSLADYGNNNNAWTGDKNDGRDHVMAKNVDPWNVEPSAKVAKFVTV